jgi:hypothetical protein
MHFPLPSRERERVRAISEETTLTSNPLPPKEGEEVKFLEDDITT